MNQDGFRLAGVGSIEDELDEERRWVERGGVSEQGQNDQFVNGEEEFEESEEDNGNEGQKGRSKANNKGKVSDFVLPRVNTKGTKQDLRLIPAQPANSGAVLNPLAEAYDSKEKLADGMWHMTGDVSGGKRDAKGHLPEGQYEFGIDMATCDPRLHQAVQVLINRDPYNVAALTCFNDAIKYHHLDVPREIERKKDIEKYGGLEKVPKDWLEERITPYFTIKYGEMVTRIDHVEPATRSVCDSLDVFRHSLELVAAGKYPVTFTPRPPRKVGKKEDAKADADDEGKKDTDKEKGKGKEKGEGDDNDEGGNDDEDGNEDQNEDEIGDGGFLVGNYVGAMREQVWRAWGYDSEPEWVNSDPSEDEDECEDSVEEAEPKTDQEAVQECNVVATAGKGGLEEVNESVEDEKVIEPGRDSDTLMQGLSHST